MARATYAGPPLGLSLCSLVLVQVTCPRRGCGTAWAIVASCQLSEPDWRVQCRRCGALTAQAPEVIAARI